VSSHSPPRILLAVATAAATVLGLTAAGTAQAAQSAVRTYVVQLAAAPAAASELAAQRSAALRAVPGARKLYDYQHAFPGFAARLTDDQATALRRTPGVVSVVADQVVQVDTVATPTFLGLDGAGGVWASRFGDAARAGEGVIVGVVDSGFWPEAPSFAPLPSPRPDQAAIDAKWHGTCDPGQDGQIACNNKVIGARWYRQAPIPGTVAGEFNSPRDFNGHGSHTASTAAGNNGVPAIVGGTDLGRISGMAPAARLAIYKACWSQPSGGASCSTIDLMAAIDQAVADGVDVINYSISGSQNSVLDPIEVAFRNAAAAGVFVSTSAGNNGDTIGESSVAHNDPWVTTVAASTHPRGFTKRVVLGNGSTVAGIGMGPGVPTSPFVHASLVGMTGADPTAVNLCTPGTLDPAKAAGRIVACDRGVVARVAKSQAVKQAGGIGMVLINIVQGSLDADLHSVPTVHLDHVSGAPVRAYSLTAGATASITPTDPTPVRAPSMASFSSFGPALAGGGDLLKPDLTAPGVSVLAAAAPPGPIGQGEVFGQISGTSMASPHVAGVAALMVAAHPDWSPMAIKSALMTTASTVDNAGQPIQRGAAAATPLDFGAGHLTPPPAFDPGLVYDSGEPDWLRYSCGIGQHPRSPSGADLCPSVGSIDPSNMNYPSIAIGDIGGAQTVVRQVTNVSDRLGVYRPTVAAPAGYSVRVTPSVLAVPPGNSRTFLVTFTRTTAVAGQWSFGSLTWADGSGHRVRSPIALRGVPLAAPADLVRSGRTGLTTVVANPAYTGTLTASLTGFVAPAVTSLALGAPDENTAFDPSDPAVGPHTASHTVVVSSAADLARFGTVEGDYPAGTDLDVYVYQQTPDGLVLVGGSNVSGTAEDAATFLGLPAGTYEVFVDAGGPPGGGPTTAKLYTWLASGSAGNALVAPARQSVRTGRDAVTLVAWVGLPAGARSLALVTFTDGTNAVGHTVIRVDA